MLPTPSLCVPEPVVVMAAVIHQPQSATAIRVGEEQLVRRLCAHRLALSMASATRYTLREGMLSLCDVCELCCWRTCWLTAFRIPAFRVLDQKGERCLCTPGFLGHSCQLGLHDSGGAGQWWRVSEGNPHTPPRTGSAGVYLSSTGAMYLFGGKWDTTHFTQYWTERLNNTSIIFAQLHWQIFNLITLQSSLCSFIYKSS